MADQFPHAARAALLASPDGEFSLEPIHLCDPRENEIRVRMEACGVCHTDAICKHVVPTPSILGHEGVGIVTELGPGVTGLAFGDRVVLAYPFCGTCAACRRNEPYHCKHNAVLSFSGRRLDGSTPACGEMGEINAAFFQQSAFSTEVIVPANIAVCVDKDIPAEILAAFPCGISTGAGAVLNSLSVGKGDAILIFGTGAVGLAAVMAAKLAGADPIIAVDINIERLSLALRLGATHTFNGSDPSPSLKEKIFEIMPDGAPHILDTSAARPVWSVALECVSPGGTFGFVSVPEPMEKYSIKPLSLMFRAASMKAIIQGNAVSAEFIPCLINWYREGKLPVDKLVKTYPLSAINQAFADSKDGTVIKPVILFDKEQSTT